MDTLFASEEKKERLLQEIAAHIIAWYKFHQRDLPWRHSRDPYCIWVAEIMLQQTQVSTVIPYYHRFLSAFPTVRKLAGAPLDSVLKAWENLGYYSRARHLHAAAGEVVDRFNGTVPDTWDELISLPGIGDYTAGAILSTAFNHAYPAVDGNVKRVLARVFAVKEAIDLSETKKKIHALAQQLVPQEDPGFFNQGLMDLGSMVCKPKKPACMDCPIQHHCRGYEQNLPDVLPIRQKKRPVPHKRIAAGIIYNQKGRMLIIKRPHKGFLGGLWKLPGGELKAGETIISGLKKRVYEEARIPIEVNEPLIAIKHAYSHFRITLQAFQCTCLQDGSATRGPARRQWAGAARLKDLAFSKADRKIIDYLLSKSDRLHR